ncbi:MAG: hypothetical protein KJ621_18440 [Proteobacteria bacterium]|nr:hypothetical protein [Pseudomonadota bacterium]MBU1740865.1 hypothetical protein [Pseudomonadota bacterium]
MSGGETPRTESASDNKVVRLVPEKKPKLRVKRRSYDDCEHLPAELDPRLRTVRCLKCGLFLDPMQVLIELVNKHHPYWVNLQRAENEFKRLQKDLVEVRRELRNAKARLRRVQRKGGQTS